MGMSKPELMEVEGVLMVMEPIGTAVQRHAGFFTNSDRESYSHSYLKFAHGPLGLPATGPKAHGKATVIMQLASNTPENTTHTLSTICSRNNPAASGLWGPDGHFSETRFAELITHIQKRDYITQADVTSFLAALMIRVHGVPKKELHHMVVLPHKTIAGTAFKGMVKIPWESVTQGSFNDLFVMATDLWVRDDATSTTTTTTTVDVNESKVENKKKWVPAVRLSTVHLFYHNFPVIAIRNLAGLLPVPRPSETSNHSSSKCIMM